MPVILTIWESEIGKIVVLGQPEQKKKNCETLFQPIVGTHVLSQQQKA
jgi:hypothetical protein